MPEHYGGGGASPCRSRRTPHDLRSSRPQGRGQLPAESSRGEPGLLLFTDIVDSTRTASEIGDERWSKLLDEHHRLARRQLEIHGGREVKTTGDGFLATFESPTRAIRCARDIRDALRGLGLGLRAGIHTGECEVDGRDLAGLAVHLAARLQTAAEPGEILVSSTVRDLVAGSGIALAARGQQKLKGIDETWAVFAVDVG